jgi:carbon-monoxide dehydrogenase medium subunit
MSDAGIGRPPGDDARVPLRPFALVEPESVAQACARLAEYGDDARCIAGGNSLVFLMKKGLVAPRALINLSAVADLPAEIRGEGDGGVRIGALATHAAVARSPILAQAFPVLPRMALGIGSARVRTSGTIGGSLCYGDPAIDTAPVLMALDAILRLRSSRGERTLPVGDFLTGYYETALGPEELVTEIQVPAASGGRRAAYLKFCGHRAESSMAVGIALAARQDGDGAVRDARIVVGAAGPVPQRARRAEEALAGGPVTAARIADAARAAADEVEIREDIWGSAWYKRRVIGVLVRRGFTDLLGIGGNGGGRR